MRPPLLKRFTTNLPEVILLESVPTAKKFEIGLGLLASFKLDSRKLNATGDVFPFVAIVAVQKRTKMKGDLILTEFPEHSVVPGYGLIELKALIMKNQNDYVVLGDTAGISRLVDKNGKIPHRRSPLKAKTPGATPRP